jgi:site-specific DNA recombinase
MRCSIYARYSTDNQDEASIESQIEQCKAYIDREGWELADGCIFPDYAVSGSTLHRPGLDALLRAAEGRKRPFDAVVVFSRSRLSRSTLGDLQLTGQLEGLGIQLVSVSEPLHHLTGSGKVAAEGALRLVNEVYLAQVSEHVKRGQDHTAARGFKTTWPPFGYKPHWMPTGEIDKRTGEPKRKLQWIVDQRAAEVVKWIFQTYLAGNGLKRLANMLNGEKVPAPKGGSWSSSAIREMLRNHSYLGWYCLGKHSRIKGPDGKKRYIDRPFEDWRVWKGSHEAIVTEDLFNQVQERMKRVARHHHMSHAKADHSQYLLTGLLKCSLCGANMIVQATRSKPGEPARYWHYVCSTRTHRGASVCANDKRIPMRQLDTLVLQTTGEKLLDPHLITKVARQAEAIVEQARLSAYEERDLIRERKEIEKQVENLMVHCAASEERYPGAAEALYGRLHELRSRLKEIEATLERPRKAQEKVARLMLPFFGDRKVAIEYTARKEKTLANWHAYLQTEMGKWIEAINKRSPAQVRESLKKHIRKITAAPDGTITVEGTHEGILRQAGLIETGDLGTIEIVRAPKRGSTRKGGVPNGI